MHFDFETHPSIWLYDVSSLQTKTWASSVAASAEQPVHPLTILTGRCFVLTISNHVPSPSYVILATAPTTVSLSPRVYQNHPLMHSLSEPFLLHRWLQLHLEVFATHAVAQTHRGNPMGHMPGLTWGLWRLGKVWGYRVYRVYSLHLFLLPASC